MEKIKLNEKGFQELTEEEASKIKGGNPIIKWVIQTVVEGMVWDYHGYVCVSDNA